MSTLDLTFVPAVDESLTSVTATPATPTIAAYGTWYGWGTLTWTASDDAVADVVLCSGYVTAAISAITCTGTDQLAVYVRTRLVNNTTSYEVWASAATQMVFRRIGAVEYNPLNFVASCNDRFQTSDLLVANENYTCHFEVMKEQIIGTPTCTLTVVDSSVFADAALVNP